jgi:hypothetical protein
MAKVIVTNGAALKAKYGAGFDLVATVKPLIDADRRRGTTTRVVDLSDAADMRGLGATAVKRARDPKQNKDAIDAVFKKLRPHFLVLLGSIDVVPHQDLRNPMRGDGDAQALGDLPYACEAKYSRRIADFRGPTRVVGRLPDATGAKRPAALKAAIATAAKARSRPRSAYDDALGITARVWRDSTALSLRNTFGTAREMKVSPAAGPRWQRPFLSRRMHFINCHGAPVDPQFYGEGGGDYPTSHSAAYLDGRIAEGTVAAAECCYGAELYDASEAGGQAGIAATYLTNGAYGFFGSSTIAYGPAAGNGAADLICQYFLQRVLAGASLGRAALEARQRFVRNTSVLDPVDLKTLGQFSLIGDPSIVPVRRPAGDREGRRANLHALGLALEGGRSFAEARRSTPKASERALAALRDELGMADAEVASYSIEAAPVVARAAAAAAGPRVADAIHVLTRASDAGPVRQVRAVVATERGGEIVAVRDLVSR